MKIARPSLAALAALVAFAVAGCSTPDSRIRAKPELFATFPPEVQQHIRAGEIAIGFNEDMVRMAAGRPDRTVLRMTETGTNVVWIYTAPDPQDSGRFVSTTTYVRDRRGRVLPMADTVWVDDYAWHDRDRMERLRVEFREGRVTGIEAAK